MKWFKFYGQDWLTDMKIIKMSVEDRLCFITLLCLASAADEGGLVRDCDEETLIRLTNLHENPYDDNNEVTRARGCLKRYAALQSVTLHDNGDVTVINFGRRQEENLSNAERQKRYRERLKTTTKSSNDSDVTQSNDSNARIDKNRIDKNREEGATPAQEAESFFEKGEEYNKLLEIFSKDRDRKRIEIEFNKFILYWTERNKSGTKQRWQQQSTFEVKRRLFTWLSRSKEYGEKKTAKIAFA
jgi:hypothetical protein